MRRVVGKFRFLNRLASDEQTSHVCSSSAQHERFLPAQHASIDPDRITHSLMATPFARGRSRQNASCYRVPPRAFRSNPDGCPYCGHFKVTVRSSRAKPTIALRSAKGGAVKKVELNLAVASFLAISLWSVSEPRVSLRSAPQRIVH